MTSPRTNPAHQPPSGWTNGPHLLAVDAKGYVWRAYPPGAVLDGQEVWSMAPVNPDDSPIPTPVTFYAPIGEGPATWPAALLGEREELRAETPRDRLALPHPRLFLRRF